MKKLPIFLLLFFLIFSYSFFFATPVTLAGECDKCICHDPAGGTGTKDLSPQVSSAACDAACKGSAGYNNTATTHTCTAGASGSDNGGSTGQIVLKDPLNLPKGDPTALWARLIGALLAFVGVGALVTFVYAGFMFLTSSGNPEQVKKAKDTMIYAVLGVAVSMGAYVILSYIFDILQGATTG